MKKFLRFPYEELSGVLSGRITITIRVRDDYGKYKKGDVVILLVESKTYDTDILILDIKKTPLGKLPKKIQCEIRESVDMEAHYCGDRWIPAIHLSDDDSCDVIRFGVLESYRDRERVDELATWGCQGRDVLKSSQAHAQERILFVHDSKELWIGSDPLPATMPI